MESTNSLRAFRKEQLANTAIGDPKGDANNLQRMRGPGATVQRHESGDMSVMTSDMSCFTMDSVNLRKLQLVADPIEDGGAYYAGDDSFADHESISRASVFSEYPTPVSRGVNKCMSNESLGPIRFDKLQITGPPAHQSRPSGTQGSTDEDDDDDKSFGSMTSGLTTDFTDHDFLDDSEGEEDCDDLAEIQEALSEEE
jgi:hypothetical protein